MDRCYREIALTNRGVSMSADNETMNRSPINRDTEILPFDGNAIFLTCCAADSLPTSSSLPSSSRHLIPLFCLEPATAGESWVNGNRSWCEFDSNRVEEVPGKRDFDETRYTIGWKRSRSDVLIKFLIIRLKSLINQFRKMIIY